MMKIKYDLHVHSVLSPCADELMTPNNILNMAYLNKLDAIAVTDHNSLKQIKTVLEIGMSYDFMVIPGVEIQVQGGHLLAYFTKSEYQSFDYELEKLVTDEEPQDEQVIMDVFDLEVSRYNKNLSKDINCSLSDVLELIKKHRGVTILAHLDKDKYSLKDVVKVEDIKHIDGIELLSHSNEEMFLSKYPIFEGLRIYRNSDSHTITDVGNFENLLETDDKVFMKLFEELRNE